MKTTKEKKKEVYAEVYNKGVIATSREQIISYIRKADYIFLNKQAKYNNGNQSLQITIEINSDIAKKLDANQP